MGTPTQQPPAGSCRCTIAGPTGMYTEGVVVVAGLEMVAATVTGAEPATVAVSGTEVATATVEGSGTGVVTEALPAAEKRLAPSPDTHPSFQGCSC
jgi:hypothetical protein